MSTVVGRGTVSVAPVDASGQRLIALRGEHDVATLPLLEHETCGIWQQPWAAIIDLSEAEFIDAGVIRWLVQGVRLLDARGARKLRVVEGASDSVASHALAVFGLRDQLDCYPTLEAASARRHDGAAAAEPAPPSSARASVGADPSPTSAAGQSDPGAMAGALFDQLAMRAWALALWIAKDEHVAEEVLIRALGRGIHAHGEEPVSHAEMLWAVRRHAIVLASLRPQAMAGPRHLDGLPPRSPAEAHAIRVRDAIATLPEPQRVTLELALFARLTPGEIGTLRGTPRSEVLALLGDAMSALKPLKHVGRAVTVVDTARLRLVRERFVAATVAIPSDCDRGVAAGQVRHSRTIEGN